MLCNHKTGASCIHRVPIFENLSANEIEALAAVVQSRPYKKGQFIFHEGERSETLFILNEGTVKISKLDTNGKEQIIRFLFPGDFFGQFSLLQEATHYANAEVLDYAVICFVQKQDFRTILEQNPKISYQFLLAMSERLRQSDDWLGTISLMETERRLAKMIILFYEKNGLQPRFRLPAQKKELAAWLGTTPETLSRKLTRFEQLGLLAIEGKHIVIQDPEKLKDYAN